MDLPVTKIVHNGQARAVETSNMIASYLSDIQKEVDNGLKDSKQESVEEAVKKYLPFDSVEQNADSYDLVVCDEDMIKQLITRYYPQGFRGSAYVWHVIHWNRVTHICIFILGHHWLR